MIVLKKKASDIERDYSEFLEKYKEMKFVTFTMKEYPCKLRNIQGLPYNLFYYGELPNDDIPSVAIVGARNCSTYGRDMAMYFGRELASHGVQIISGMASGIDGISQREALEYGAKSFGILGCGADICYPASNRLLYEKLKNEGGIISEYPPGMRPYRANFPARNRIISGLSDYVLVMEARAKSGSLITASMAAEQGKDVYALPGPVTSDLSRGCHELIADGAGILISGEQLVSDIKNRFSMVESCPAKDSAIPKKKLESKENHLKQMITRLLEIIKNCKANDKFDADESIPYRVVQRYIASSWQEYTKR